MKHRTFKQRSSGLKVKERRNKTRRSRREPKRHWTGIAVPHNIVVGGGSVNIPDLPGISTDIRDLGDGDVELTLRIEASPQTAFGVSARSINTLDAALRQYRRTYSGSNPAAGLTVPDPRHAMRGIVSWLLSNPPRDCKSSKQ